MKFVKTGGNKNHNKRTCSRNCQNWNCLKGCRFAYLVLSPAAAPAVGSVQSSPVFSEQRGSCPSSTDRQPLQKPETHLPGRTRTNAKNESSDRAV